MKHVVYKENDVYRYQISDRRVLYKTECFFRRMKVTLKLFSKVLKNESYRWMNEKKVNLLNLYIYSQIYHSTANACCPQYYQLFPKYPIERVS